ncbi:MAG: HAMP domain-containing sensor histidine kinase [Litorimonas sp.]
MIMHGFQGNPEFMLQSAKTLRAAKASFGQPINRYELMTNFVYTLNRARDFEGAANVAELLVNEPKPDDIVVGLAELYMATTYNEIGIYENAQSLSRLALQEATHPVVENSANLQLAVALSGLGLEDAARTHMASLGWDYTPQDLLSSVDEQTALHAESLLAMHRGETAYALALMKRRSDILVGRVRSANSGDMSAMLSNLENSRSRQAEREAALQREAELKAIQLEQKNRLNRMLWVLIGLLTVAFNLLLAFLRYREKNNAKLRILQEEALSAEKMKTEFLGVINHELRTPLNGIIGISDAMIHHAEDPALREQAVAVQESGQLLHDLLDSLITMSTIEGDRLVLDEESLKPARVLEAVARDWRGAADSKGLDYTWHIAPDLSRAVKGDAAVLRRCVRYLLSNAVRFTHAGRVHMHATAEPDADGRMALSVIVADTGQGISEEVQSRLFKPFLQADATMTRKYGGAGLSLAIARKLARMMGGDLVVSSREGRGSEFIFTASLPLAEAAPAQPVMAALETQADLQTDLRADLQADPTLDTGPDLADVDDPEEIIDLMLSHPIFADHENGAAKGEPSRKAG